MPALSLATRAVKPSLLTVVTAVTNVRFVSAVLGAPFASAVHSNSGRGDELANGVLNVIAISPSAGTSDTPVTTVPLEPLEREIMCMRYGLEGHDRRSLDEIGRVFECPKERARQIEARMKSLVAEGNPRKLLDIAHAIKS